MGFIPWLLLKNYSSSSAGSEEIKELLKQMIPTYMDSNEINV